MEARTRRLDLATLLSPLSVEDFLTKYWARRPLHVKGAADKYTGFFDRARFDRAIKTLDSTGATVRMRATFDAAQKVPGRVPQLPLTAAAVPQAYDAGATICVTSLHMHDDELARFVNGICAELGYPGMAACNSYLSPHGCGFGMHFDARIACTLQLEGSKWWTFSHDTAVPWPPSNAAFDNGRARYDKKEHESDWSEARVFSEAEYSTVLLEPGDFLALPAGTWHGARAEGHSLALNLAFEPIDASTVIATLLRNEFESEPEWRSVLPSGQGQQDVADAYMRARIDEAIRFLQSIRPDGEAARNTWGQLVMTNRGSALARDIAPRTKDISATDVLRIPLDSVTFAQEVDGGTALKVHVDGHSIDVEGNSRAFLHEIMTRGSFVAAESRSWFPVGPLSWDEARSTLQALVDEGILEVAAGADVTRSGG